MRKIIIITHGDFGKSLLDVATNFFGANESFKSLVFDENMEVSVLEKKICSEVGNNLELLCLVDIKGGTPYNVAKKIAMVNSDVEVITGVNLGMILQLIVQPDSSIEQIKSAAIESIGG